MKASEIQALRLQILKKIYDMANGIAKKTVYSGHYHKEFSEIDTERLNGEIQYLVDKRYLIELNSVSYQGTKLIKDIAISSFGIDLIQKIELKSPLDRFENDFSGEAIKIYNINASEGSNVVIESPETTIIQSGSEDSKILLEFLEKFKEKALVEKDDASVQAADIIIGDVKKGSSLDTIKGSFKVLLSIGSKITANLLTPTIKALLISYGIDIP